MFGKITDGFDPLEGVKVEIRGGQAEGFSDRDGDYEIWAAPRNELVFTRAGMDTLVIVVEDVTGRLNLEMHRKTEALDEVTVTEKRLSPQKRLAMKYFETPTMIHTSFGYIDSEKSAYHFYMIDGKDINLAAPDIVSVIASRVPGARVRLNSLGEKIILFRGGVGSISQLRPPLYEIDQMLFTDTPHWLPLQNIVRIGIIPGLQAVWRYGNIATGGVVVINTTNGGHGLREEGSAQRYDQARLRNNFVQGEALSEADAFRNAPTYLVELEDATSLAQANGIIRKYANAFSADPYYFLENYKSLYQNWGAQPADSLLDAHAAIFDSDPVALKSLAYTYQGQKREDKAHALLREIFILRPDYAQSYLDLADSYYALGEVRKAYALMARYQDLIDRNLATRDTLDLVPLMAHDRMALTARLPDVRKEPSETEPGGTRLVFAWSDAEAEFELQFVNPGKQFYTWKHGLQADADRVYREKVHGFTAQEFFLDASLPGQWEVRASYAGNKKLSPTYLKMILYRNFGLPSQTREVQTFRLDIRNVSRRLAVFGIGTPGVVVR